MVTSVGLIRPVVNGPLFAHAGGHNWAMGIDKPLKPIDQATRNILRDNVLALRAAHHADLSDREWFDRIKVARSTMRHVIEADSGASVDTLAAIARAYDLQPWQLLFPGLDAAAESKVAPAVTKKRRAAAIV